MEQIALAFDLGATSGRCSILGTLRDGKLQMKGV